MKTSISDFVDGAVNNMKLHAVFVEYDRKVRDGNPLAGARIYVFVMDQSSNTTMAKGYRVVIFRLRMEKTRWVSIFITDPWRCVPPRTF